MVVNSLNSVGGMSQSVAREYRTSVIVDPVVFVSVTWSVNIAPLAAEGVYACVTCRPPIVVIEVALVGVETKLTPVTLAEPSAFAE
jgi:hypothetical protein